MQLDQVVVALAITGALVFSFIGVFVCERRLSEAEEEKGTHDHAE